MRRLIKMSALLMTVVVMLTFMNGATREVSAKGIPYINYKSVYVIEGKTFKVKLMNLPKGAKVKWKSSNKKVATVKAGKIKGVGAGNCKVTATYKKKKYSCKVKVQRDLTVKKTKFTSVTFNMTTLKMDVQKITYTDEATPVYAGKNSQFQLKVYNTKKSAKWKTSNANIATVSKKGLITAKNKGKCKITATVSGKKVSCNVTVTDLKNETEIAKQEMRYEMLRRLNIDRIKAKAKPLKMLDSLNQAADIRAKECAEKWSHTRPNGQDFGSVYKQVGIKVWKVIGENVAYTIDKPEKVEDYVQYAYKNLYDNTAHRKVMLDSKYECVGIGYYNGGHVKDASGKLTVKSYWAQEFYTK